MGSAPFLGGGFGHFYTYAPVKIQYAIDRYAMETKRQYDVLDRHLADHPQLSRLAEVTFEWSASVKDSGSFTTRVLRDEAFAKDCVGSIRRF